MVVIRELEFLNINEHSVTVNNMYMNEQDAQNSCD